MSERETEASEKDRCLSQEELALLAVSDSNDVRENEKFKHLNNCKNCFDEYTRLMFFLHAPGGEKKRSGVVRVFSRSMNIKAFFWAVFLFVAFLVLLLFLYR